MPAAIPWSVSTAGIPLRARMEVDAICLSGAEEEPARPTVVDAAVFLAAAAVTTGTVVVRNWDRLAGGAAALVLRDALASMGAYVVRSAEGLTCTTRSTSGYLTGIHQDLSAVPELAPTLVVLAAMAEGPSSFRGVSEHAATATTRSGLQALGGLTRVEDDVLHVLPRPLHGGPWTGDGDDHVTALGAVLGLVVPGVEVHGVEEGSAGAGRFLRAWQAALAADEHILPGTSSGTVPYYH